MSKEISASEASALLGAWSRIVGSPEMSAPDHFRRTRHRCDYCDVVFIMNSHQRCINCGAPVTAMTIVQSLIDETAT
jgi:hypothetical protein